MASLTYHNDPISNEKPVVFAPANRCIYCKDGRPPFTKEHIIPRGMGGGMIYPKASCEDCRKIILEIETYCMRGPFLPHRLNIGLVHDLNDLGSTIRMPIIIDGKRHEKTFPTDEHPNYLVLPAFHDPPRLLTGKDVGVSYSLWGVEEELTELDKQGNAILVEKYDLDKFGRAIAKIAHGYVVGEYGLDSFNFFLPDYILGKTSEHGSTWIGNWGEDGMLRHKNILHQIGHQFVAYEDTTLIEVRLRLFAAYENTPVYRLLVGALIKPIDDVLAPRGRRSVPFES